MVLLDQVSKWSITNHLEPFHVVSIIPGFFNLVVVKNRGMAFGILGKSSSEFTSYLLLGATLVAIVVVFLFFYWAKKDQKWLTTGLALILGGAVGNLIDRTRFGYVIDFLDFHLNGYHWPAFNIADSAVTVGALWLLLNIILGKNLSKRTG